jgi:anti-anti-sigma regulatory factor
MTPLPKELVIGRVKEASRELNTAMVLVTAEEGRVLELDGSAVRRVDGVGVQLLVACHKAALATGVALQIVNCSDELREALTFIGIAERYGIGAR